LAVRTVTVPVARPHRDTPTVSVAVRTASDSSRQIKRKARGPVVSRARPPPEAAPQHPERHGPAYGTLAKILGALRAHDTETIEALADPRLRSSRPGGEQDVVVREFDEADDDEDQEEAATRVSGEAGVLRFSEERDPAALTQFVRLRVMGPEGAYWRRGIKAARRWRRETGSTELRVHYTYLTPDDWPNWRLQKDKSTLESGFPHAAA
jgi:hypothetical protein